MYHFEPQPMKLRRRYINGFSYKPHPFKIIIYTLLWGIAFAILAELAVSAMDKGNQRRCHLYPSECPYYNITLK